MKDSWQNWIKHNLYKLHFIYTILIFKESGLPKITSPAYFFSAYTHYLTNYFLTALRH